MLVDGEGRLTGIFTDSDLARLFEHRRDHELDGPIREVMTASPITVRDGPRIADAVAVMAGRKISELPVVDADGPSGGAGGRDRPGGPASARGGAERNWADKTDCAAGTGDLGANYRVFAEPSRDGPRRLEKAEDEACGSSKLTGSGCRACSPSHEPIANHYPRIHAESPMNSGPNAASRSSWCWPTSTGC